MGNPWDIDALKTVKKTSKCVTYSILVIIICYSCHAFRIRGCKQGMSHWQKQLNTPLSLLVKTKSIPNKPIEELQLDLDRPIFYLLPFHSKADQLTLRHAALKWGLPDPLDPVEIAGQSFERCIYVSMGPKIFKTKAATSPSLPSQALFENLLMLSKDNDALDIQLLPAAILWGRQPGKEDKAIPQLRPLNGLQKFMTILMHGRDCLVRLSAPVSLRYMADHHGADQAIAQKLSRVAKIHFSRQQRAAAGPRLPDRNALFKRLIKSKAIENIIETEASARQVPIEKVKKEAFGMMEEIATDFSYPLIKHGSAALGWLWNRLYQGINVNNAQTVRKLAQEGHEIVYVPCHRSHMDYLLLSYVLYQEGMVPPHIAAGINLNFFPAGPIFRRGGAFFIRRSFKGDQLYSTVFREYLSELFAKGYSVEYFSEGGRSRTGRLLPAKPGMLSMTLQAMLRGLNRPVTLVPIYIGYEHVMEVSTYAKELQGKRKEKENVGQVLKTVRKLRNFGQGYVNFGEPISLNHYLNEQVPEWHKDKDPIQPTKPQWLNPAVNDLAVKMMTNINDAAATNALNLCALAVLASRQRALSREKLEQQLICYLDLLKHVPYSTHSTLPEAEANRLIDHAIEMDKFIVEKDTLGEIISLNRQQSILMTYYRNNIIHLFAVPSLIARLVTQHQTISMNEIQENVARLFPFLKAELFLNHSEENLPLYVEKNINELIRQGLLEKNDDNISISQNRLGKLLLLSRIINETLQRYSVTVTLLQTQPHWDKTEVQSQSQAVAQRLSRLHGINAPEFFDKGVFSTLVETLQSEGYLLETNDCVPDKISNLADLLTGLLSSDVRLTLQGVMQKQ